MKDPIVDEVRAVRAQIAKECDYDLTRIIEHARRVAEAVPGIERVTLDELQRRRTEGEGPISTATVRPTE